jgi:hypothetical protein
MAAIIRKTISNTRGIFIAGGREVMGSYGCMGGRGSIGRKRRRYYECGPKPAWN